MRSPADLLRTLAIVLALTLAPSAGQADSCSTPQNADVLLSDMGAALNALRGAKKRTALTRTAALDRAAQAHACDVAGTGVTGTEGSDGSDVEARTRAAGFETCRAIQVQAVGPAYGGDAMALWWGQRGGRNAMLSRDTNSYGLGVALAGRTPVWVLVFAQACTTS